ncbi:MAG: rhodanese-like domain-containing protein [Kofleriaceae bacterium]
MMLARLAVATCALWLSLAACSKKPTSSEAPAASPASAPKSAADEALALFDNGAPVIDVRTKEEWDDGHLPQATLIPIQEFDGRISEVADLVGGDKTKPVVVVCRSGNRAAKAKAALEAAGFTHVVNGGRWENLAK